MKALIAIFAFVPLLMTICVASPISIAGTGQIKIGDRCNDTRTCPYPNHPNTDKNEEFDEYFLHFSDYNIFVDCPGGDSNSVNVNYQCLSDFTLVIKLEGELRRPKDVFDEFTVELNYNCVGDTFTRLIEWFGLPRCIRNCDHFADPDNGDVIYESLHENDSEMSAAVGTIATFSCKHGYELTGEKTLTCEINQETNTTKWSGDGKAPTCRPLCPRLERLIDGSITYDPEAGPSDQYINWDTKATHRCNPGSKLVGEMKRTCQNDGTWSGVAPTCQPLCPRLERLIDGSITYDPEAGPSDEYINWDTKATHQCNTRFGLVGGSERTCQSDGTWSGVAPTCQPLCPRLERLIDGSITYNPDTGDKYLKPGNKATHQCNTGFGLVGGSERTCQSDGTWSGIAPTCQPLCPRLERLIDGSITYNPEAGPSDKYIKPGTKAIHQCKTGFGLVGGSERTCQSDGTWSGVTPTCQRTCPHDLTVGNGIVTFNPNTRPIFSGSTATYECINNYIITGEPVRICQEDGTWSGVAPVCKEPEPVTCRGDLTLTNGKIEYSQPPRPNGGYEPPTQATHTCNKDYRRIGAEILRCQENEQWTPQPPRCERITCPPLSPLINGEIKYTEPRGPPSPVPGNYLPPTLAKHKCNNGYIRKGQEYLECQDNGEWNYDSPTCEPSTECPKLHDKLIPASADNGNEYTEVIRKLKKYHHGWVKNQPLITRDFNNGFNEGSTYKVTCNQINENGWFELKGNFTGIETCERNDDGILAWTRTNWCYYKLGNGKGVKGPATP